MSSEADHIILQKYLYDNWPDDGSVDPRRSDILWGQEYSGMGDISLIVEGGTPNDRTLDTGRKIKDNRQTVMLKAYVRDLTGIYPDKIHNIRKFITDFIRLHHADDYLYNTWGIHYIRVRRMNTQRMPRSKQRADVYRLRMAIDVIKMTEVS